MPRCCTPLLPSTFNLGPPGAVHAQCARAAGGGADGAVLPAQPPGGGPQVVQHAGTCLQYMRYNTQLWPGGRRRGWGYSSCVRRPLAGVRACRHAVEELARVLPGLAGPAPPPHRRAPKPSPPPSTPIHPPSIHPRCRASAGWSRWMRRPQTLRPARRRRPRSASPPGRTSGTSPSCATCRCACVCVLQCVLQAAHAQPSAPAEHPRRWPAGAAAYPLAPTT